MLQILYNIVITPLELFIEIVYTCSFRLLHSAGFAILAVSIFVNIILLPLYLRADTLCAEETERQKKLSLQRKHILSAFASDERIFILNKYYRKMNYHPIMAAYSLIPLLLQVPFFIAAYNFFSNLSELSRNSFFIISDLSQPDGLLTLPNDIVIHVLPILMTVINCLSVYVYTQNMPTKDKLRSYAMAFVFLILLYSSPSGLMIYWTANNLFSLVKNIVLSKKTQSKTKTKFQSHTENFSIIPYLLLLELTLFLGGIVPADVVVSSGYEMVNVGINTPPLHYVFFPLQVYGGLFLLWGIVLRIIIPKEKQSIYTVFLLVLTTTFLINYYCFPYTGSSLSNSLTFLFTPDKLSLTFIIRNTIVTFFGALLVVLLWKKYPKIILATTTMLPIASLVFFLRNVNIIHNVSSRWYETHSYEQNHDNSNIIPLSRNGKNVMVIGLDRAVNNYLPFILAEKPELLQSFDGFTWYPDTVSFGAQTPLAMPPLMGGYEYTPLKMNARTEETVTAKTNEALRVMPALFSDAGYQVTVIDPPLANYQTPGDVSIYDDIPNVNAFLMDGYYATPDEKENASHLLERNICFFSLYRCVPVLFNGYIYDDGRYLNAAGALPPSSFIEAHAVLKNLARVSTVSDSYENNFLLLYNNTTHEPSLLVPPDYNVDNSLTGYNEPLPQDLTSGEQTLSFNSENNSTSFSVAHYHINMAAFLRLADYFDYLKKEGVWDNTRIIIVADHGMSLENFDYLLLLLDLDTQNSSKIDDVTIDTEAFNPLLMVKDFNTTGFSVDYSFMTNADVPSIATSGLITAPVNPYTLLPLCTDSQKISIDIPYVTLGDGATFGNTFPIEDCAMLHVHDSIYDSSNWSITFGSN